MQLGARALILDDGFQHRRLYRDFELIVLDARNLFGSGNFLPEVYSAIRLRDSNKPTRYSSAI